MLTTSCKHSRPVSCLPVCVCLSVCRCLRLSLYLCVCVSICVVVVGLSGGRSICLPVCLDRSVCLWSICLCACLRASVYICLSICLSVCLFVCLSVCLSLPLSVYLFAVGRSVGRLSVFLSCRSVTVCTKRAGSGGEDAESESGRLRTQERQIGLMNVELRTGAESRGLRARS